MMQESKTLFPMIITWHLFLHVARPAKGIGEFKIYDATATKTSQILHI